MDTQIVLNSVEISKNEEMERVSRRLQVLENKVYELVVYLNDVREFVDPEDRDLRVSTYEHLVTSIEDLMKILTPKTKLALWMEELPIVGDMILEDEYSDENETISVSF